MRNGGTQRRRCSLDPPRVQRGGASIYTVRGAREGTSRVNSQEENHNKYLMSKAWQVRQEPASKVSGERVSLPLE